MGGFKVIFLEHGYQSVQPERSIVENAGGTFVDGDLFGLNKAFEEARDADAVMLRRIPIGREEMRRFERCRMLMRYGVGVDNIDLDAATEAGILVGHVPVYCQDEVSTHAIALMLACVRRLVTTHEKLAADGWNVHDGDPVFRLGGKTVGIVGLGTLGQAVAAKLGGWNLRLIATDPYVDSEIAGRLGVTLVTLETLLGESDIVSLHVPLLPETKHLINRRTLNLMKRGAILVNTARGPAVSAADLLEALNQGKLSCAALDVFEQEPPAEDSPLRKHPKLIITDHIAWYSEESQLELQKCAAEEVVRYCTGKLPTAIANPEVLKKLGRAEEWTPNYLAVWQARRAAKMA